MYGMRSFMAAILVLSTFVVGGYSLAHCQTLKVTVHPNIRHQTIRGWEVTLPLSVRIQEDLAYIRHDFPEALFDVMANESGIDRLRMEIRSGAERPDRVAARFVSGDIDYETYKAKFYQPINDNDDPFVINPDGFDFSELDYYAESFVLPLLARDPDRKIQITLCYVHFRDVPIVHLDPDEYAELILAAFRHLDTRWGLVPDLVEVILEPDNVSDPIFIPERVASIVAVTSARMKEKGYAPRFIVGSVVNPDNAQGYLEAVEALPAALKNVAEVNYHRYFHASRRTLSRLYERARSSGIETSMLEWWSSNADGSVLLEDLTIGGVSSWQNAYLKDFVSIDGGNPSTITARFRGLASAFRNVPRGSVRLEATGDAYGRIAPFERPDGSLALLFWSNDESVLSVAGFADAKSVDARYYDPDGAEHKLSGNLTDDGNIEISVPGSGLVVIADDRSQFR